MGQSQFQEAAPGWKFRVKTLDKEVIEIPEGNVATIMPDEFFQHLRQDRPRHDKLQALGIRPLSQHA